MAEKNLQVIRALLKEMDKSLNEIALLREAVQQRDTAIQIFENDSKVSLEKIKELQLKMYQFRTNLKYKDDFITCEETIRKYKDMLRHERNDFHEEVSR